MKRLAEEDDQKSASSVDQLVNKKIKAVSDDQQLELNGHQASEDEKKLSEMIRFKKKLSSVSFLLLSRMDSGSEVFDWSSFGLKKKAKLILTLTTIGASLDDEAEEAPTARPEDGPKQLSKEEMPLYFVQDLQRVVLFSLIGDQFRFYPR